MKIYTGSACLNEGNNGKQPNLMSNQNDKPGLRPTPASKAGERTLKAPVEVGQEADADNSLNRLAQLLKPRPPPAPSVPRRIAVEVAYPPPGAKGELERDPSLPATAQWQLRRRALISLALAMLVTSFFMLNGGRDLLKRGLTAAAPHRPIATQPSKDEVPVNAD